MRIQRLLLSLARLSGMVAALQIPVVLATLLEPRTHAVGPVLLAETTLPLLAACLVAAIFWAALSLIAGSGTEELRDHEAYLMAAVGWLWMILLGALPYVFVVPGVAGVFESFAGFTATNIGAIRPSSLPMSLLLWRAIQQWVIGFGAVVVMVGLLSRLTPGGGQLLQTERPGPRTGRIRVRLTQTAAALWRPYVLWSAAVAAALVVLRWGEPHVWRDAILHAMTAVSTGGFSTYDEGASALGRAGLVVVSVGAVAGALGMLVWQALGRRRWSVLRSYELRLWLASLLGLMVWNAIAFSYRGWSVFDGVIAVASVASTSGIVPLNLDWPRTSLILLVFSMFMGGLMGSTAGGMKAARIAVMARMTLLEIRRLLHPRAVFLTRFGSKIVRQDTVLGVIAFFFMFLTTWMAGTLVIASFETEMDLLGGAAASAAALSNTGGVTWQMTDLEPTTQWAVAALMWLGRIEILAAVLALAPRSWRS